MFDNVVPKCSNRLTTPQMNTITQRTTFVSNDVRCNEMFSSLDQGFRFIERTATMD